jgi:predicted amidophosphoribosyltransferase
VKKIMGLQSTSIAYHNSSFRHYYLCHYLPLSAGKDIFSRSLLKFKRRIQPDLDAWIDCSLEVLKDISLSPDTIVLRALSHDETSLSPARLTFPTALDIFGNALVRRFGCHYLPSLLLKSRPSLPCKELSREQRLAELRNIYSVDPAIPIPIPPIPPPSASIIPPPTGEIAPAPFPPSTTPGLPPLAGSAPPSPSFLLIDDILTTGTTMRMIIRALRRQFPRCPIRIFTLARSDYDPALNLSSPLHGQNYHLEDSTGWVVAEEERESYTHPKPEGYSHPKPQAYTLPQPEDYSMETLKKWISANSF